MAWADPHSLSAARGMPGRTGPARPGSALSLIPPPGSPPGGATIEPLPIPRPIRKPFRRASLLLLQPGRPAGWAYLACGGMIPSATAARRRVRPRRPPFPERVPFPAGAVLVVLLRPIFSVAMRRPGRMPRPPVTSFPPQPSRLPGRQYRMQPCRRECLAGGGVFVPLDFGSSGYSVSRGGCRRMARLVRQLAMKWE